MHLQRSGVRSAILMQALCLEGFKGQPGPISRPKNIAQGLIDPSTAPAPSPPLAKGTRARVSACTGPTWINGSTALSLASSGLEDGDDGHKQRATHILYDAVGPWRTAMQLSYWHCLDEEHRQQAGNG